MSCALFLLWLVAIAGTLALLRLWRRVAAQADRQEALSRELERLREVVDGQRAAPLPAAGREPPAVDEKEPPAEEPRLPAVAPPTAVEAPPPAVPPTAVEAPPPPYQPPPAPPRRRPTIAIDWERWVGVRGAAVLGGVVLALAAVLFLEYSIEHDLIPPIVRVALGFLAGGGSIAASETMRRRGYRATADAVAGAGVVMLYASVWAARVLYGLIPGPVAWGLMVLVTVACGLLSWRRESLVIALLGLLGGFLTPLLLATGRVDPIGLFSYILLLDGALLWLALRRRWPLLLIPSLGATFLYQAGWIFGRMTLDRLPLTLGILAAFAVLFALAGGGRTAESDADGLWRLARAAGILLPFCFALHFAWRADLGVHLLPVAALSALLSLAAVWVARRQRAGWLPVAVAAADLAVVAAWMARSRLDEPLAWEASGIAAGLALAFHWPLELDRRREPALPEAAFFASGLAAVGLGALVIFEPLAGARTGIFWPWLAGWLVLVALTARQGELHLRSTGRGTLLMVAALAPGVALAWFLERFGGGAAMPAFALFCGLGVAIALAYQMPAVLVRDGKGPSRDLAAGLASLVLLGGLSLHAASSRFAPLVLLTTTLALAALVLVAATRRTSGLLYAGGAAVLAAGHWIWTFGSPAANDPLVAGSALALELVAVLLFAFWPFAAGRRLAGNRWALYAAALAAPAWFPALKHLYLVVFGDAAIALLPIALGGLSLVAALAARRLWQTSHPAHRRSLVWFLAVALGFVSLAIPLQLDKQWITIGWAVQGLAVIALWRRLDHPGLRYFGLALLAAATVRLVANPALLGYYQRGGWPVLNWLLYTYLVPAAALLASARLLAPAEVSRRSAWETRLYAGATPVAAGLCSMAAVLVIFVWINLTIVDAFSTGFRLELSLARMPARDLTLSLAWAVYALVLLAAGMTRKSRALRWVSLAFLVLTIGKVFLYDLGELRELYRVASLVGLALSLLAVSLAYQRFVFRDDLVREGSEEER